LSGAHTVNAGYQANSHFHTLLERIMMNRICLTLALALLCVAATSPAAFASENAYMYLVQGVPGLDYSSSTDPEFPVDVLINNETCYIHGLTFGTITGPLTLVPGSYDVKISVANSLAPCTEAPLVDSTVTLDGGKNVSAVFALSSTGAPTIDTFSNNFSAVSVGNARISFALAADSPAVQVILENTSTQKLYTYSANPGTLLNELLPAGNYTIEINEGTTTLVPSTSLTLDSQSVVLIFADGEQSNGTITLQTKTVRNVI
jgi:hypothetical protein